MLRRRLPPLVLATLIAASLGLAPRAQAATVRTMHFPVEGKVSYSNDFGAPRVGHTHQGNDIFGKKLQPVLATRDGYLSWGKTDASGSAGNYLVLRDLDGWTYWYMHLNNDTPGTDDGANPARWRLWPGVQIGRFVVRGEPIAYMGDSGNAEGTPPHVHFEIHQPDGTVVNPYDSLQRGSREARPLAVSLATNPTGGHYVLNADGRVHRYGVARYYGRPTFAVGVEARDLAVMPDGLGYVVLDSAGLVYSYGSAVAAFAELAPADLAGAPPRAIDVMPDGAGYVVLDGYGGVHRVGTAASLANPVVHDGTDTARDIEITPDGVGYVVLEWNGATSRMGSAAVSLAGVEDPVLSAGRAQRLLISPSGAGFAVLATNGALHGRGDLEPMTSQMYNKSARFVGIDGTADTVFLGRRDSLSGSWYSVRLAAAGG